MMPVCNTEVEVSFFVVHFAEAVQPSLLAAKNKDY
jgi:hypothetical protein